MNQSASDSLTNQFYSWELRGRGWLLYDEPIQLEPPFMPFIPYRPELKPFEDDGRKKTILGKLFSYLTPKKDILHESDDDYTAEEIKPYLYESDYDLTVLRFILPRGSKIRAEDTEQLIFMISNIQTHVSFEIIGKIDHIAFQFVCEKSDASFIENQIKAFYPGSIITRSEEYLNSILEPAIPYMCIGDMGLKEEFTRPISLPKSLDPDPLTGIIGVMSEICPGEQASIQILISKTINPWGEQILQSTITRDGKSFFADSPEMPSLAKSKVDYPIYAASIRFIGQSDNSQRAQTIALNLSRSITQSSWSNSNSLTVLEGYSFEALMEDIYLRNSRRLGMLLNGLELINLVHWPYASLSNERFWKDTRKTRNIPPLAIGHPFVLGINRHQGIEKLATQSTANRLKHTHIIGATGTGKSTMLINMIKQDLDLGNGLAVLDPHGDLVESILSLIPKERIEDVIIIDPSDSEFPIAFNILSAHSEIEKDILSSDLVAVFKRLSTSWGDQMNSVFANAILAFLESDTGGTLADMRRFLIEKPYRESFLKSVKDPNVVYYWQKEYPLLKSSSIGPILTRLDSFLRPKLIRNMVSQKSGLDFENILDTQKILLVKLSHGLIGVENSYLLGSFVVSKIYQAAMARQAKSKDARADFFFYIDEFHHFITPSLSHILSGARKYHLGLILAHQDMQQVIKQDSEVASSIISNAGTRICFRLGDTDAKKFEDGFHSFESTDLLNLNTGEAIARIERPDFDFSIDIPGTQRSNSEIISNIVIETSRKKYGTPREEVEKILHSSMGEISSEDTEPVSTKKKKESQPTYIPEPTPEPSIPKLIPIEKKTETRHRYLQSLIKKMAESRGFRASIEEPTTDGFVDVSLERGDKRYACEISVTTEKTWELHNILKCLNAGYHEIYVCSESRPTLNAIETLCKKELSQDQIQKVLYFTPENLFKHLDEIVIKESNTETLVKGYRVKVEYSMEPESAQESKRKNIINTIGRARKD